MFPQKLARLTEALILVAFVVCCSTVLITFIVFTLPFSLPGGHTFISFWAAGRQLLHHANPYDANAVLAIERVYGYPNEFALLMRNPPSAAILGIPAALLSARAGYIAWFCASICALGMSVLLLRAVYPSNRKWIVPVAMTFAPCVICLVSAQSSLALLLGVVLYLRFHRSVPPLAGLGLWMMAAKPHLFLPFATAVVLIAWFAREFRPLLWAAGFLVLSTATALALDPQILRHYSQMAAISGVEREFVPTLATTLRFAVNEGRMAVQFLPAMAGVAWAVWTVLRERNNWDWREQAPLLLTVSLLVAPYSWASDQVIVLPAIFALLRKADRFSIFSLLALSTVATVGFVATEAHSLLSAAASVAWFAWVGTVSESDTAEIVLPASGAVQVGAA